MPQSPSRPASEPGLARPAKYGPRRANHAVAAATWDTEEHARGSPDTLGDIPSRLQALGTQIEQPEIFEVTVS